MFKIYTVTVANSAAYDENALCSAIFSNADAAENAFRNLAEKYNVEISDDDVANGFVSRLWENDDDNTGPDAEIEISIHAEEVYESYAEEREYAAQAADNFRQLVAIRLATSTITH